MKTSCIVMKETTIGAVEFIQPVDGVLRRMTVDHVEQYNDASTVRSVDQFLQLVRCAITTGEQIFIFDEFCRIIVI